MVYLMTQWRPTVNDKDRERLNALVREKIKFYLIMGCIAMVMLSCEPAAREWLVELHDAVFSPPAQ